MDDLYAELCEKFVKNLNTNDVLTVVTIYERIDNNIDNSSDLLQFLKDNGLVSTRNVEWMRKVLSCVSKGELAKEMQAYQARYGSSGVMDDSIHKKSLRIPFFRLPLPNSEFISRDKEAELMNKAASPLTFHDPMKICVLKGPPASGKTHMAIKYCYEQRDKYNIVWFQSGDGYDTYESEFHDLLENLGIICKGKSMEECVKEFEDLVASKELKWLIVVDNFEMDLDETILQFPSTGGLALLTTTQIRTPFPGSQIVNVDSFSTEELKKTFSSIFEFEFSEEKTVRLGIQLGNNPLVVNIFAHYLKNMFLTSVDAMKTVIDWEIDHLLTDTEEDDSIKNVFYNTFDRLISTDPEAWHLMKKLILLDPNGFTDEVVLRLPGAHRIDANSRLGMMRALSLVESRITPGKDDDLNIINRMVRRFAMKKMEEEEDAVEILEELIGNIYKMELGDFMIVKDWKYNSELGRHIEEIWKAVDDRISVQRRGELVYSNTRYIQWYLEVKGDLRVAESKAAVLEGRVEEEMEIGPKEFFKYVRGCIAQQKGDTVEAMCYLREGMLLIEQDDAINAWSGAKFHNAMGNSLFRMNLYDEALEEFEKAREMYESRRDGGPHFYMGNFYNNVGMCYFETSRWSEALECFRKSFEARLALCRDGDPEAELSASVGLAYLNIGSCYSKMKEVETALLYAEKALKLFQELTPNVGTQNIALAMHNLGVIYSDFGRFVEAKEHYTKSFEIYRRICGENHGMTRECIRMIGNCSKKIHSQSRSPNDPPPCKIS